RPFTITPISITIPFLIPLRWAAPIIELVEPLAQVKTDQQLKSSDDNRVPYVSTNGRWQASSIEAFSRSDKPRPAISCERVVYTVVDSSRIISATRFS
ncbi:unnamed protein product, partial [Rotaria magnacalcarata]